MENTKKPKRIYKRPFHMQYDSDVWKLIENEHITSDKDYTEIIQSAIKFYFKYKDKIVRRTPG